MRPLALHSTQRMLGTDRARVELPGLRADARARDVRALDRPCDPHARVQRQRQVVCPRQHRHLHALRALGRGQGQPGGDGRQGVQVPCDTCPNAHCTITLWSDATCMSRPQGRWRGVRQGSGVTVPRCARRTLLLSYARPTRCPVLRGAYCYQAACGAIVGMLSHFSLANGVHVRKCTLSPAHTVPYCEYYEPVLYPTTSSYCTLLLAHTARYYQACWLLTAAKGEKGKEGKEGKGKRESGE